MELKEHEFIEHTLDGFKERKGYLKSEADKVIAELKSDITDLRDDKKLTDAILSERNSEIAELKAQKAQADDDCAYWKTMAQKNAADNAVIAKQRSEALKKERHQKYKRCKAMAKWCRARYNEWVAYYPTTTTRKMKFIDKWEKRWLKIAEQFKEAK